MDLKDSLNNIESKNDEIFNENCLVISKGIHEGKTTILELIEYLNPLLTNEHVFKRELGTWVLTEVLKNISIDSLNVQQLKPLVEFYNSKLKDHHQILPAALSGILILIQFENFHKDDVSVIFKSIFHNVPCQQQQRADRYTIYQIFDVFVKLFKQELLDMKLEFVYGVLQSIENERDPRNLLFLFKWIKIFLVQFPLQHLTEDMFDILACYFPVDFKTPPNENVITRENLAEALSPCLCAISDFGDSCISLALEKLDSSLEIAKTDSLKLLKEGCSTFESSVYIEKSSEIWSLIQKEILSTKSDEIRSECLASLSTVISKISEDPNGSYLTTLQDIFDTLKGNLLPDSRLFERSSQILVYTAAGSEKSCKYVIKEVVPILTNIYTMTANNDQRSLIVKTLGEFAKVHLTFYKSLRVEDVPELLNIPLLCLELLNIQGNPKKIGLNCLIILIPYLTSEIRQKLYLSIQNLIFMPDEPDIKNSFLHCLRTAASYFPEEIKSQVFSSITPQLPIIDPLLKSMNALINLNEFREHIIENYLNILRNTEFLKIALHNLKCLVQNENNNNGLFKELIDKNVLASLLELTFTNACTIEILRDVSVILILLIAPQTSEIQNKILYKYFDVTFEKFKSCDLDILVLYGLLVPLRRDIPVQSALMCDYFDLSFSSQNEEVRNVGVQLLANLVNKSTNEENLLKFLEKTREKCTASLQHAPRNTIIVSSWITKALLLRNHSYGIKWLNWLLGWLEYYPEVSDGLRVIMNDNYDSLSEALHCQKSLLYRQKTFIYVTKKICDKYDQNKPSYLKALAYLLEFTPQNAILLQFPKICRFIILCLEKNDEPEVLRVLLTVVETICSNNSTLLETHLEDFLTRILKLTSFKSDMKIRMLSLKCLVTITVSYPVYKLLPLKSTVLNQLGMCVDDTKRLVRKEAMEARSLWYLLDGPV